VIDNQYHPHAFKLIVFDLDGTLTTFRLNGCHDAPLILLPNVADVLFSLFAEGIALALATDQKIGEWGGRQYTESIIDDRLDTLSRLVPIPRHLMLSSHVNTNQWRKPRPGMLEELMALINVAATETLFVGDRARDFETAVAASVSFAWAWDFFDWPNGESDKVVDFDKLPSIWRIP
jgi:HAD superfamily hydrolase (TIGR01662 family)